MLRLPFSGFFSPSFLFFTLLIFSTSSTVYDPAAQYYDLQAFTPEPRMLLSDLNRTLSINSDLLALNLNFTFLQNLGFRRTDLYPTLAYSEGLLFTELYFGELSATVSLFDCPPLDRINPNLRCLYPGRSSTDRLASLGFDYSQLITPTSLFIANTHILTVSALVYTQLQQLHLDLNEKLRKATVRSSQRGSLPEELTIIQDLRSKINRVRESIPHYQRLFHPTDNPLIKQSRVLTDLPSQAQITSFINLLQIDWLSYVRNLNLLIQYDFKRPLRHLRDYQALHLLDYYQTLSSESILKFGLAQLYSDMRGLMYYYPEVIRKVYFGLNY